MLLPSLPDPTHVTALHSLDFGTVHSSDGRAHPLNAMTPITVETVPDVVDPGVATSATVTAAGPCDAFVFGSPAWIGCQAATHGVATPADIAAKFLPSHAIARIVVIVLAIGILFIVAWRIAK